MLGRTSNLFDLWFCRKGVMGVSCIANGVGALFLGIYGDVPSSAMRIVYNVLPSETILISE